MKRKLLLTLPILMTSTTILGGCNIDGRIRITFGSPVVTSISKVSYNDFDTRMVNKENMLVVTYDSVLSETCTCWQTFKPIADKYADEKDIIIYLIDRKEIENNKYGLTILENSNPTCFIAKDGKVEIEYIYSSNNANAPIFQSYDAFEKQMEKVIKMPQIMLVDEAYINAAIFTDQLDNFIVYHARSGCGDCNYCTPNFLQPYCESNNLKHKVYMVDIQYLYNDKPNYQAYKDKYGMSEKGNEMYGFSTGVVPTFQYYEKGELKDACVYFNDSIERIDGKWKITDTYYTEERVKNLHYTDTVLMGKEILETEVITIAEYNYSYWNQNYAARSHNPILKSFLDYYAK